MILYKLHGSVTWYRSETGDYVRSDVLTVKDTTTSVAEKPLVPLILYPGRKLQYIEPIIYLLRELEEQIKNIKYMFVIGYSFKDDHIARLFRYAATKNRELIVFLISPSASIIYNQKLKYHNDEEFLKNFTIHSFSIKSFTRPVQSDLCGRVICLNYKFKKIFPFLKDGYLKHLIEAEELESSAKYYGSETEKNTWKDQLRHYIDCEHMDKVNEKINDIGWNKILSDDWRFSFEISFKGLLNSGLLHESVFLFV